MQSPINSSNLLEQDITWNASEQSLKNITANTITYWDLDPAPRALFVTMLVLLCLAIQAANVGIFYFERIVSDTHRTLLYKLAALISLYQAALVTVLFPLLALRLLLNSGLWTPVCWLLIEYTTSFLITFFLAYNELLMIRYVYICKIKTVGTLKEDVLLRLFVVLNAVLGCFVTLSLAMTSHVSTHHIFLFCVDATPSNEGEDEELVRV